SVNSGVNPKFGIRATSAGELITFDVELEQIVEVHQCRAHSWRHNKPPSAGLIRGGKINLSVPGIRALTCPNAAAMPCWCKTWLAVTMSCLIWSMSTGCYFHTLAPCKCPLLAQRDAPLLDDIYYDAYSSIASDGTAANTRASKEPEKQAIVDLLARYG